MVYGMKSRWGSKEYWWTSKTVYKWKNSENETEVLDFKDCENRKITLVLHSEAT